MRRGSSVSWAICAAFSASTASALPIDWVTVGEAGNPDDTTGFGSVAYPYRISSHEVTNAQYAAFLNAVAGTDTHGLYSPGMGSGFGGVRQTCGSTCSYDVIAGRGDMPVNYVSYFDALRFANWVHNGQLSGAQDATTTEAGAYTMTAQGMADNTIERNAHARIALPTEDEWYKAAYYDPGGGYFDYPTGTDLETMCASPTGTSHTANCGAVEGDLTPVGSYTGSASPYGTFDQGGNAREWNDERFGPNRGVRGGSFVSNASQLASGSRLDDIRPHNGGAVVGFRLVSVPEPGTGALLTWGLAGLALDRVRGRDRRRRTQAACAAPTCARRRGPAPQGISSQPV